MRPLKKIMHSPCRFVLAVRQAAACTASLSLALLVAGCGGKPVEPGVVVQGERLPVVDMHLHTGTWEQMTPQFQRRVAQRMPGFLQWIMPWVTPYTLSGKAILRELDSGGVNAGVVFALYSPHTTGLAPNGFVAEQIALDPRRLYGFASLRVDQWNLNGPAELARLETDLQRFDRMIGIKVAHAHQQFRFDDERFYGIYEIAGRLKKPLYLHTGTSPNPGTRLEPPYADPAYLEEAIRRYPDAVFILGHSGYDSERRALTYTDSAIALALRYEHVYLEPGALGAERAAGVLPDFLKRIHTAGLASKMIYGSDGPQMPGYIKEHLQRFVAAMEAGGYSVEQMRMILAGNFRRVFGVPPLAIRP
jgi:predicted TIM-barrel fold metal-dependent hydrolase